MEETMHMRFGMIAVALLFVSGTGLQVPPAVAQTLMKEEPPDSQDPDPIGVQSRKAIPHVGLGGRLPTAAQGTIAPNSIDGGRGNDNIGNKPLKLAPNSTIAPSTGEVQRMHSGGGSGIECAKCHDVDAIAKMTPDQIAKVQRMAREWMAKHQQ
jgi:hypothetical protein